ncbi:MAG: hypothetical protein JXR55_02205 [Candidatus Fermentibacteraceae bacterium]|nr:hypothetical protein [Candidatus Fermentibacteraceae bacterium]
MKHYAQKAFVSPPPCRRLRVFAFDPILSRSIETYQINEVVIRLPWDEELSVGPMDEYLEIVDIDPSTGVLYSPCNLDDPNVLAQDGLPPSEGNPQFHQQMVYAVARTTICHFERALGRRVLWSPHWNTKERRFEFVKRLRIYPHALREANAYYSPDKKALLFGYFSDPTMGRTRNIPGEIVFTCLSHDIIAHETTHALLDGIHRRFIEPTNRDVWALHEAFADIVALFQHFTYPEVLRHQIARTRGRLENQNLLAELAQQFGQALGKYGALRDALGSFDRKTGKWTPKDPDPSEIREMEEPHARGSILVAAVFDAFLTIYRRRIADLLRIASGGTGILPQGELHPDLVDRLAREASKTATHVLNICIRALDYCPPVDVNFGDYLRALITADFDLVPDDRHNYRLAFIDAFRARGIYPDDVAHLSVDSLLWHRSEIGGKSVRAFQRIFREVEKIRVLMPNWGPRTPREKVFTDTELSKAFLHRWLTKDGGPAISRAFHIVLKKNHAPQASYYLNKDGDPALEIHSVRPTRRVGPDGQMISELVIEITQRRRGYYDEEIQEAVDTNRMKPPKPDFYFRGGCTLLVDTNTAKVRYCIYKDIHDNVRLGDVRSFLTGESSQSSRSTYFGAPCRAYFDKLTGGGGDLETELGMEPFAMLHQTIEGEEV